MIAGLPLLPVGEATFLGLVLMSYMIGYWNQGNLGVGKR